jgi:F-type H+-transporting ATPase subunit a
MASVVLHIKDSYYFEVPKALWPVRYSSKAEFPEVWVRLDPDFQLWDAERLYSHYAQLRSDAPPFAKLKGDYVSWKADHKHAGKPFDQFLVQHADAEWFGDYLARPDNAQVWQNAVRSARNVDEYKNVDPSRWSAEKIQAYNHHLSGKILIPQPFGGSLRNLYQRESGFCLSKFMVIELGVALILCLLFGWLARRVGRGDRPQGRLWNLLESFVVFIRDQVARPAIGHHDADRFVPLLLTLFFFILGCNLSGMLPWLGSPTASFSTTLGLAVVTFATVLGSGFAKLGFFGFFANMAPKIDLPWVISLPISLFVLVIEVASLCIRHGVLAIRLLANMVAGHIVLISIMMLAFSVQGAMSSHWTLTAVIAVVGSTLLSVLELFVAFLQAYIFTFLSALFIGSAIHHH